MEITNYIDHEIEMVLIVNADGTQVCMTKATYDAQQVALSTPIVCSDE